MTNAEKEAILSIIGPHRRIRSGCDIGSVEVSRTSAIVLLEGISCRYALLESGQRQILAFQYPGDICNSYPPIGDYPDYSMSALSACTVALIQHRDLIKLVRAFPGIALLLWRSSTIDSLIGREWLVNVAFRPALQRTAHIICEQIVRLRAIDQYDGTLPITQRDLADATALSAVHFNRTIQLLRGMGVIGKSRRPIVIKRETRLREIADFQDDYLCLRAGKPNHDAALFAVNGESEAEFDARRAEDYSDQETGLSEIITP
jgi:CRP-like cAMP-binding protein